MGARAPVGEIEIMLDRLAGSQLPAKTRDLILAAAIGEAELASCIVGTPPIAPPPLPRDVSESPAMFLAEIAIEGVRGIADRVQLGFRPGPGLTLVVGRNGTGKSSFAEGAELALTATSSRWSGRKKAWEDGWANLHYQGQRQVELRLVLDGQAGQTLVSRTWDKDAALADGRAFAQLPGKRRQPLADLGLSAALSTWRPFLSYNELGSLLDDGPSRLYDAISRVLGLEEWVEVEQRITGARKALDSEAKAVRTEAERLRSLLSAQDDERARAVLAALPARKTWDLDAIEALAVGGIQPSSASSALEALVAVPLVDPTEAASRAGALRQAATRAAEAAAGDAGAAQELALLLEKALSVHDHTAVSDCPVCGSKSVLDAAWCRATEVQIQQLRLKAAVVENTTRDLARAQGAARSVVGERPPTVDAGAPGVDTGRVSELWSVWSTPPESAEGLASHLETHAEPLALAIVEMRRDATTELKRRQDAWKPLAAQVAAWLPGARTVQATAGQIATLKDAGVWLNDESNMLRNERFRPIADHVQATWDTLRQDSNVSLDTVTLQGTNTRRRVDLSVSVDDTSGAALAVMSQGELHALSLSLFLPRVTLPQSPFRFVVVDDPVQAMDASRVDGLARVLSEVASSHQVIVFTHDERLQEATRRLGLPATVLEVSRGRRSKVTVRVRQSPVRDYIADARVVLLTKGYPPQARSRVIPGLCRNAVEAACADTSRRKLMAFGLPHVEVQRCLDDAGGFTQLMALALWRDSNRGGEILSEVDRLWGRRARDCIQALQKGSHKLIDNDPEELIRQAEKLANAVLELK